MKLVIFAIIPIFLSTFVLAQDYRIVEKVLDGDTVVLDKGETVRLIGIDTPEDDYYMKKVRVTGVIKKYKGKPEIIVKSPSQIAILKE